MHFELSFKKPITVVGSASYLNDCCWGGDVIRDYLFPFISSKYENIVTNQEDWGWFLWFQRNNVQLAVDIFCDDIPGKEFRVRLYSTRRKFFLFHSEVDAPELAELKDLITAQLQAWTGEVKVEMVP